jgi:neuron navigator 2
MEHNIQACLNFLLARGVSVQDIQAKEIREGSLKAILGLFFQLSRYKQQQKMIQQQTGKSSFKRISLITYFLQNL